MKPFIDDDGEVEGSHSRKHTKALKQFSRRPLKRKEGTGRVVNGRLSFESLQLSGKKPAPATINSLQKDITNTLKENVDPETRVSQNVDDFWEVERQKRLSAIARRRLSGVEAIKQPVGDRYARHLRSRREGGRRLSRPKKVQDFIDEGAVADWDKESLEEEEEEEKQCTIASSQAFMQAQETALRASLPLLDALNPRLEVASSPAVRKASASADGDQDPKEQTPQEDKQEDTKSLVSLEDMDVSTGEHTGIVIMQKDIDLGSPTPNLASLIEMDCSASSLPKVPLEHGLTSKGNPGCSSLGQKRKPLSSRDQKKLQDDLQTARFREVPAAYLNHERRTPHAERKRMSVLSPTPPSKPLAAYVSRRRLTNEIGEVGGRKLQFDSSSPCSSLDLGDDFQIPDQIPDLVSGWTKIMADEEILDGDSPECDNQVHVEPHERVDAEEQAGVLTQSDESCSMHATTSTVKQETRQKLGSNLSTKSTNGPNSKSTEVDVPQTSVRETSEMEEAHRGVLPCGAETPSPKDNGGECAETIEVNQVQAAAVHSGKKKRSKLTSLSSLNEPTSEENGGECAETIEVNQVQATAVHSGKKKRSKLTSLSSLNEPTSEDKKQNTPRVDDLPGSPIRSMKTKHTETSAVADAAKSLISEGKDTANSPRATRIPVSAPKSVKNTLGEKTSLSSTARALSFEVHEIEAIHDNEKVESLVDERHEAVEPEPEIVLPDDVEENASQPSAGLVCQHADTTTETQSCVDRRSEPEEITAELDTCDPQSQVVDNPADIIQPETLEQPRSKRRRKEDQTSTEISLSTDQPSQVEEVPADSLQPEPQKRHPNAKRPKKKDQKKRCSLEGPETGLTWTQEGHRRSQRRRMRPLEWWRGEKLLYGRVHDSLTTVIGVKHSSPGAYARGDRVPFLVKSFVPAKYNELIRLAAT